MSGLYTNVIRRPEKVDDYASRHRGMIGFRVTSSAFSIPDAPKQKARRVLYPPSSIKPLTPQVDFYRGKTGVQGRLVRKGAAEGCWERYVRMTAGYASTA